ncbi:hypothetical protein AURDEDRAFT_126550 [Auricularia subglabra TFB-10046 SS5]|nr:hypothetical protein AURDEDRAFT_126550 [Auricularia subglabra TFB-10046 SS5]
MNNATKRWVRTVRHVPDGPSRGGVAVTPAPHRRNINDRGEHLPFWRPSAASPAAVTVKRRWEDLGWAIRAAYLHRTSTGDGAHGRRSASEIVSDDLHRYVSVLQGEKRERITYITLRPSLDGWSRPRHPGGIVGGNTSPLAPGRWRRRHRPRAGSRASAAVLWTATRGSGSLVGSVWRADDLQIDASGQVTIGKSQTHHQVPSAAASCSTKTMRLRRRHAEPILSLARTCRRPDDPDRKATVEANAAKAALYRVVCSQRRIIDLMVASALRWEGKNGCDSQWRGRCETAQRSAAARARRRRRKKRTRLVPRRLRAIFAARAGFRVLLLRARAADGRAREHADQALVAAAGELSEGKPGCGRPDQATGELRGSSQHRRDA